MSQEALSILRALEHPEADRTVADLLMQASQATEV
jgi:hypothetical protein